jgi:hypothetical protein
MTSATKRNSFTGYCFVTANDGLRIICEFFGAVIANFLKWMDQRTCRERNKHGPQRPIREGRIEDLFLREQISRECDGVKAFSRLASRVYETRRFLVNYAAPECRPREIRGESTNARLFLKNIRGSDCAPTLAKRVMRQSLKRNTCTEEKNAKYSRHVDVTTKTRSPDHFFFTLQNFLDCINCTFETF